VDDVDAVAGREYVRPHLWVPAAGLVPEVDASLQQLLQRYLRHVFMPPCCSSVRRSPRVVRGQGSAPDVCTRSGSDRRVDSTQPEPRSRGCRGFPARGAGALGALAARVVAAGLEWPIAALALDQRLPAD